MFARTAFSLYEGARTSVRVDFVLSDELEIYVGFNKDPCCRLFFLQLL